MNSKSPEYNVGEGLGMMRGTFMVTLSPGPQTHDLRHQGNVREREW